MPLFRRKRDVGDPDDGGAGLKDTDRAVLDQLTRAGADLTEPRHVLHYLYVSSEEVAYAAAAEARDAAYDVEVRDPLPEYPDQWLVLCQAHDVVTSAEVVRGATDFFERMAATHSGEYDGWEASV